MTIENLKTSITAAEVFLRRASKCLLTVDPKQYHVYASKESGAIRRASMELTRALAELRKSS